jgi:malonyl-CoA/methylmalonyl-CoA synthetase
MKIVSINKLTITIRTSLVQHPAVAECCVLGLQDKDYGEAVCALIVPDAYTKRKQEEDLKPALSLEELCTWAKDKLAPYKVL